MQAVDPTLGSYEASLPPALESVVAARRLVESAASEWGIEPLVTEDAALAVSELVSNAVLHGAARSGSSFAAWETGCVLRSSTAATGYRWWEPTAQRSCWRPAR